MPFRARLKNIKTKNKAPNPKQRFMPLSLHLVAFLLHDPTILAFEKAMPMKSGSDVRFLHFEKNSHKIIIHKTAAFAQAQIKIEEKREEKRGENEEAIENRKTVYGRKKEFVRPDTPVQKTIVRPTSVTQQSLQSVLERDASFISTDIGVTTASGFTLPQVRGSDTKMTSFYLNDVSLTDPWSAYPISGDIDVRAFGEVEFSKGFNPELTGSSTGAVIFKDRPIASHKSSVGSELGSAYGVSLWGKHQTQLSPGHRMSLYARTHQTDGKYPFYNDNQTPYNTDDDKEDLRTSNESQSHLFVPIYTYQSANWRLKYIAVASVNEKNLPVPTNNITNVESSRSFIFNSFSATQKLQNERHFFFPNSILYSLSHLYYQEKTKDPDQTILFGETEFNLTNRSSDAGMKLSYDNHSLGLSLGRASAFQLQSSQVKATYNQKIKFFKNLSSHLLLQKVQIETRQNGASATLDSGRGTEGDSPRNYSLVNKGVNLHFRLNKSFSSYGQISSSERPPSLLEEFGTGRGIKGNPDLESEKLQHKELGFRYQSQDREFTGSFSLFSDEVTDKIVFVGATGYQLIAINLDQTLTQGGEFWLEYKILPFAIELSYTHLNAKNTGENQPTLIPRIPSDSGFFKITHNHNMVMVSMSAKYRSEVYTDRSNNNKLPGYVLFDLSLEKNLQTSFFTSKNSVKLGFHISNILGKTSVPVQSGGTSNFEGITHVANLWGEPLPGRSYKLSIELEL